MKNSSNEFITVAEMNKYLSLLNERLKAVGEYGEICIAGGSCLALSFKARNATHDIDAFFEPNKTIKKIIKSIADENDLKDDWLNDNLKISGTTKIAWETYKELSNLKIYTASAESMLAMKLFSARPEGHDFDDTIFLMKIVKPKTEQEAIDILENHYLKSAIEQASYYFTAQAFETYNQELLKENKLTKSKKR
jgi:hypothetical protein